MKASTPTRHLLRMPQWWCVLFLAATCCFLPAAGWRDEIQCPAYRQPDDPNKYYDHQEDGKSIQYMAPNGCDCVPGMFDMHCSFCETDAGCQTENPNHVCRRGDVFTAEDTYKSYKCRLFGTLETLFNNGKLSIYVNRSAQTAQLSIYNWDIKEPINGEHGIDCELQGCDLPIGGTSGSCANAVCNCTQHCSDFVKTMVEDMISGNTAQFVVTPQGNESLMQVAIEGAPFPIEAMCNATACSEAPNATHNDTVDIDLPFPQFEQGWTDSSYFALLILLVIVGVFGLLTVLVAIPICMTQQPVPPNNKSTAGGAMMDDTSVANSPTGSIEQGTAGLDGPQRQVLEFRHISKVVRLRPDAAKQNGSAEKMILNNISGRVESGTLMAIMGPSGSGKSSLLNILAAVDTQGVSRVSGQILLNGVLQKVGYRTQVAYVQQDDALYSTLTVRECVEYSALLRLPKALKSRDKQAQVWQTLQELRLTEVADNRIGHTSGNGRAGISGGERKRVSIGMELVAKAPVLVLDEPTSGLDAYGANQLVKVLHQLSSRGNRVVILSIHQPSMKSFMSMDQILLLGHGRCMFKGSPADVQGHLEARGFPCPPMETVADHMLDVVSKKKNLPRLKGADATPANYATLCLNKPPESRTNPATSQAFSTYLQDEVDSAGGWQEMSAERGSPLNEIAVLFARTAKDIFRNTELFFMQITISLVLALFAGGIFNDVSNNLAGFQNRTGAFYFCLSFFAFASFSSMDLFVKERHIFVRETGSKYYYAFSYFLTKTVLDLFMLRVIPVALFTFIFYWMMGLKNEAYAFVTFLATIVLFNVCAGIMSICISVASPTVGQANLIAAVWFLVMLLFGGFLLNIQTMAPWYSWLKYLSIFYYSFEILMSNELSGLVLSFDAPGYPALPIQGEVFLKTIGMDAENQLRDLACLCGLALGFTVLAFFLLLLRVPPSANTLFSAMQKENKRLAMSMTRRPSAAMSGFLSYQELQSQQFTTVDRQSAEDLDHRVLVSPASHASNNNISFEAVNQDNQDSDVVEI